MSGVFGRSIFASALITILTVGLVAWNNSSRAASDPKASSSSSGDSDTENSVKIEPYTGPPIYLEEPEVIAKPTIVTRDNLPEKYDDGKTIRVERQVAHYSDNNFAADGNYREYYPSGKPFIEGKFKEGRQVGDWTYYFENGTVNRKATYADGKANGSWEIHREDGTLAAKRGFKDGIRDGEWITYDATGKQPLSEEHYANGKEDGTWKVWFANGKQKQQATFKDGKREGTSTEWNDKGDKLIEADYADNKLNGTATRYLPDGKKMTQTYKDGRFVSESK